MKKKKVYICPIVEKVYVSGMNIMAAYSTNTDPHGEAKIHHTGESSNDTWRVGYDSDWPTVTSPWEKE